MLKFLWALMVKQEICWNVVWLPAEGQQEQEPKWDLVHERKHQLKKYWRYYEQFSEAKHPEYRSWVDNEVFDLMDMRKVEPWNYVTGRWVLTIKTDKQGNFLRAKARWVLRGFQDKQKEYLQTDSPASTRLGLRMGCQMAASQGRNLFHIDLRTAFRQGQSYDVNRDVVCQLPSEASHPPWHSCKIEETCIRHEWCLPTLVKYPWRSTV